LGTNRIVGTSTERIVRAAMEALDDSSTGTSHARLPPLWDGHTAPRILDALLEKV
jgi:UDP-N-acetylglucosamine 2-epimerase